jgi:bifunctional non-homologous end joining protein LigD
LIARPPDPGWSHEIKHDGFRIVALKQGALVKVWSRRAADFTGRFQRIAEAVRGLNVDQAMIDGEAVVFQDDGRSDFHALLTKRGWLMASFVAFDLLRLDDDDLRQRPLEKRREALARLIAKRRGDGIVFSEALVDEGAVVFAKACQLGRTMSRSTAVTSGPSTHGRMGFPISPGVRSNACRKISVDWLGPCLGRFGATAAGASSIG